MTSVMGLHCPAHPLEGTVNAVGWVASSSASVITRRLLVFKTCPDFFDAPHRYGRKLFRGKDSRNTRQENAAVTLFSKILSSEPQLSECR